MTGPGWLFIHHLHLHGFEIYYSTNLNQPQWRQQAHRRARSYLLEVALLDKDEKSLDLALDPDSLLSSNRPFFLLHMGHFRNNNMFATYRIYQTILSMIAHNLRSRMRTTLVTVGPPLIHTTAQAIGYAGLWVLRCKFGCKSRFGSCRNLWVMGVYGL